MSNETVTLTVSRIHATILSLALNEFNQRFNGTGMFGPEHEKAHRDLYWYLVSAVSEPESILCECGADYQTWNDYDVKCVDDGLHVWER